MSVALRSRNGRWRRARALGLALGLAAGLAGCGEPALPPVDRVVLVTIDTLRADHVGAYGAARAHTPVLDGLAATGVRFANAITPAPLTLPSHTSMLTGLEPPAHGVRSNSVYELSPEVPIATERLKARGYATAAFVAAAVLDARFGLSRGFDVYDDDTEDRMAGGSFSFSERPANKVVKAALDWVETAPDRFFLWVHLYDPHAGYQPPPAFARLVPGDAYAGEIAFADAQVGRLLQGIERRFGPLGTAVLVTSDHGDALGEHGEATHGMTIYDATQRVPLLLRAPGLPAGAVIEAPVRAIDVGPTLLDLAGAEPLPGARGSSLVPLARGGREPERVAYSEATEPQVSFGWSSLLALRTATHRYIRAPRPELYELASDPDELANVYAEHPELAGRLDAQLDEILAEAAERTPAASGPSAELDAEERARLEALGYVVPEAGSLESMVVGEVGGPDPKDHMHEAAAAQRARVLVDQGLGERALAVLTGIPLRSKHAVRVRKEAAFLAGRFDVLEEIAREEIQEDPTDGSHHYLLGTALVGQGRLDEAEAAYREVLLLDPENPRGPLGLATVALSRGDPEGERLWTERAVALEKEPAAAHVHLAILELNAGNPDGAYALLAKVPRAFLERGNHSARIAAAEHAAGRSDAALARLEEVLASRPGTIPLLAGQARILEEIGRASDAVALRRRILELVPVDPGARNDLAWSLALAGQGLDEALQLTREAIAELGELPSILDTLATVHLARGEAAEALSAADRALATAEPRLRPHLLYLRAAALAELGRRDGARAALAELAREPAALSPLWESRVRSLRESLGS